MDKLDTKKWKKFYLTDLFEITGSKTTSKKDLENCGFGEYPYVTTKATNGGIDGMYNLFTEEGNVLTVDSAVVGHCTYQGKNFSASDHVEKLVPKFELNKHIAIFLVSIINKEKYRYNYGRKCSQDRLKQMYVNLPVKNGKPDWEFMEGYIKSTYQVVVAEAKEKPISNKKLNLNTEKWEYFMIEDEFDVSIAKSVDLLNIKNHTGTINYIGRTVENNGVITRVGVDEFLTDFINKGDCLSVVMVGEAGTSFFQQKDFFASQNILLLRNKKLNKYNALFISNIIRLEKYRFSYGRTLSKSYFENHKIRLPVVDNEVDWKFMEDYIKTLPYSSSL